MTLLGKILTVLIFVMSILFMGFAVAVYATHRNWHDLVNNPTPSAGQPLGLRHQLRNQNEVRDEKQSQLEETRKKLAMERASRRQALSGLETQRQELMTELTQLSERNAGASIKRMGGG